MPTRDIIQRRGEKRHRVSVYLPATSVGTRGQKSSTAADTEVAANVPCSILTLSGREGERARQVMADATSQVELDYNECPSLTTQHYLKFGTRQLNIGYADNVDQRNVVWKLLCGETR